MLYLIVPMRYRFSLPACLLLAWASALFAAPAGRIEVKVTRFYDPNTPYANAVRSARLLGNAVLLTLNGYGHLSFQDPSACIDHARVRYLVDLRAPPRGTVCQPDQPPFATSS